MWKDDAATKDEAKEEDKEETLKASTLSQKEESAALDADKKSSLVDLEQGKVLSQDLEKESSISSAEIEDQVSGEPIDIISMRKCLRRQTTMCPTKSNLHHQYA